MDWVRKQDKYWILPLTSCQSDVSNFSLVLNIFVFLSRRKSLSSQSPVVFQPLNPLSWGSPAPYFTLRSSLKFILLKHSLLGREVIFIGCWHPIFRCHLRLVRWDQLGSPSSLVNHSVYRKVDATDNAVSLSPMHMQLHLYESLWTVFPSSDISEPSCSSNLWLSLNLKRNKNDNLPRRSIGDSEQGRGKGQPVDRC